MAMSCDFNTISLSRDLNRNKNDIALHKTVSTFETFMNNNKMKRRIFKMNNNMTGDTAEGRSLKSKSSLNGNERTNHKKRFAFWNAPPGFWNKIVNEGKFKNEIKAMSPMMGSERRKEFYLTDIMQTKYTFGPLCRLNRDREHVKKVSNEMGSQKEDSVHRYMKGFKYKVDSPMKPIRGSLYKK